MSVVLAYVDENLARQIASGLIGSEVSLSERRGTQIGVNFKIIVSNDRSVVRATTTKLSELLPEVIADAIHDAVTERVDDLSKVRHRLVAGGENSYRPGTPLLVTNAQLSAEDKKISFLGGEECMQYRLKVGEFYFYACCSRSSEIIFDSLTNQPIEVVGLLRYTPPYSVPGALSYNLSLRACAVWLR